MVPIFRKYITKSISSFIQAEFPSFLEVKVKGSKGRNSVIWECSQNDSISLYLQLRFIKGRDYVIPNIQWSKLNRFPSEDCITEEELEVAEDNLDILNERDEVWLSACEFGKFQNYIRLTNETPSEVRLAEIFNDISEEALNEAGITDWKSDYTYHEWDMLDGLDSNVITEADAEYATNGLVQELKELISIQFMPYLIGVAEKNN